MAKSRHLAQKFGNPPPATHLFLFLHRRIAQQESIPNSTGPKIATVPSK